MATDHEISHGRNIIGTLRAKQAPEHIREAWIDTSWILEVTAMGSRDSKPFHAIHLFLTCMRTAPDALLQLVRDRWSIEAGTGSVTPSSMKMPTATGAMVPA